MRAGGTVERRRTRRRRNGNAPLARQPLSLRVVTTHPTARTWIGALRDSHDRLVSVIDAMTPEQLTGPSYCQEWTVAQVLSHLGSGAEIFALLLDAGLSGQEPPGRDAFPPIWDSWNGRSPERQAEDCRTVDGAFIERLETLDDQALAALRLPMFGMELDATGLSRMRLSEHALHLWDVAVAVDPAATVAPEPAALLVDNLGQVAGRTGKSDGKRQKILVVTSDPARHLLLAIDDPVELTGVSGVTTEATTDATIELPAEAFLRLVYGRLDPTHTPAGVKTAGVDLDELRQLFPGL